MATADFDDLTSARERFESSGLILPPVPADFADRLHEFEEPRMWSTRAEPHDLYGFRAAVSEAESPTVSDYLAFGHAGHGANSWAVSYYLVRGPLKLLLQIPWGGVYMDSTQATASAISALEQAAELISAFDALSDASASVSVFASGFYGVSSAIRGPINGAIGSIIGDLMGLLG